MSVSLNRAEPAQAAPQEQRAQRTLQTLVRGLAERGEREAIVQTLEGGVRRTTYRELGALVGRFASGVQDAGVKRGEPVALAAATDLDWIVACLGLIGAGAVPVPLDTQLDDEALRRILAYCKPRCVLTEEAQLERLDAAGFGGDRLLFDAPEGDSRSWRRWLAAEPRALPVLDPEDRALLFYTSGTTGPPKGVPLKHHHLAFQLETIAKANLVESTDRVLQPLPLHHVYPLVVGTLAPLALGLPIVLPQGMTGPELVRALREGEVTFIIGVPKLYEALYAGIRGRMEQAPFGVRGLLKGGLAMSVWLRRRLGLRAGKTLVYPLHRRLAPNLRVLASGGSALDSELAMNLEGLGWQVAVGYGLTETAPLLTLNPPGTPVLDSVGKPIAGIEVKIDPSAHPGSPGASGREEGEVLARGESVFDGYLGREGDSSSDDFTDGWYRTGDLGWIDADGYLHLTGRVKTLIVTGAGKNIVPDELEDAYAEHPVIQEIGVFGAKEGLLAVIVPAEREISQREGGFSEGAAVRSAVNEVSRRLPSYKRLSHYVVSHRPIERTRLGKVKRHRLEPRYRELLRSGGEDEKPSPISPEEMSPEDRRLLQDEKAREVWELLARRYPDRRLTPDSSMQLDLGVDSLGWLDLSTELAQQAGVSLREERIAQIDAVRDLLAEVAARSEADIDMRAPLEDPESVLSPEQLRWVDPLSRSERLAARPLWALNRGLMKSAYRLRVSGLEHLQGDPERLVITPNHTSYLDPFLIGAALPEPVLRRTFWGGWTGIAFRNAVFRRGSRLAQAIPIDPERGVISSLVYAAAVLGRGDHLVWFPEGERSFDGKLGDFRPGLGVLLEKFPRASVVPVHISGAFEAWPRDRRAPRLHRVSMRVAAPQQAEQLAERGEGEERRERIMNGLRSLMLSMAEEAEREGGSSSSE